MKKMIKLLISSCLLIMNADGFSAAPPVVALSSTPLYSGGGGVHPNLLLDLSVEFPTVKYAYSGISYDKTVDFLGYFNPKKCYTYPGGTATYKDYNNNSQTVLTPENAAAGTEYFSISGNADANHECTNAFSGNFMNWASSSAIDMLRLALTGGDRIESLDTSTQTVLQRAFLSVSTSNFYRSSYFPQLSITGGGNVSAPNKVTPFNVTTLKIVNCENKIQFADSTNNAALSCGVSRLSNGKLAKTDKFWGEFYARVNVCDANENTTRTDLCMQYPSGNYKPVGQMQRNQNNVRYGAFGYLMDQTNTRYGGVLRAPLKYVGSKQYKPTNSFIEEVNDRPEWDATTGVFTANPENDATGNSGVINYLNKFGRTGTYKGYDPLSELYYESIRYLQGRQPTPDAISNMTTAMKDNFQVLTTWTDPIEASCQRNYTITIGDANTHQDKYIPGNTRTGTGDVARPADTASTQWPAFDVMAQTAKVASMESTTTYGNAAPVASLANMSTADTGSSGGTFYMVGAAYWANTNDIRLDKPVRVKTFTIDVDENGNGSIDNATRSNTAPRLSQLYLAAKYGGFTDINSDGSPFKTFAADGKTVINSNKEWASGNNTDPDNFFLASNPAKMISAISKIFQTVATSGGTLSGVGVSSTKSSENPYIYIPGFNGERWSGSLKKVSALTVNAPVLWDANVILSGDPASNVAANPLPSARKIYTAKVAANGSLSTIEFLWNSGGNFSTSDQTALNTDPHTNTVDNRGSDRINYLRGDRSFETDAGGFRVRSGVLGDIINSAPVYYGPPAKNISGTGYSTFYAANIGRQKAVYVGANDGMLHAFNADTGVELFSYVPNAVISKLNQLTDPYYSHQSFVDGKMTVKEAQVNGAWKTLLLSGMGSGSKGIFALDVTNPANFTGGLGALWEFTDKNDSDMGYVLTPPLIAKFRTGTVSGKPVYGNFAVISSGYNNFNTADVNAVNKPGALFLLSLDKDPSAPWVSGSNYFKLTTASTSLNLALRNALAAPNVAYGGDGAVNYAYAGDLQGNLWRFVFTGGSLSSAIASTKPVFTAKTPAGVAQPITVRPQIVFAAGGGYIISFGTGKYVESYDTSAANYDTSSYYAVLDTTYNADAVTGRSQLEQRTATASGAGYTLTGNTFNYGTLPGSKKGWYFDYYNSATSGERSVTDGAIAGQTLFFNSLLLSNDPCSGGSGRIYQIDLLTGLSSGVTGTVSTIGILSSPIIFNTSTTVGDRNATGARRTVTTRTVIIPGTGNTNGQTTTSIATPDQASKTGRLSWRELQNWQELRNDANK
ncbi:pilus assembly protein [Undibacterium sp. SXout7W]|uniref:pilus assembly protein n=1 Tax=Undibacterium sp. SXout7W TaxID=3413049 RepID=UPI003BF2842A